MASSDDKPEDEATEAAKGEGTVPAAKAKRRKSLSKAPSGDGAASGDGTIMEADSNTGESPTAAPTESADAPSGDVSEPDAGMESSEPLKFGPAERGPDTPETRPEPEDAAVPDLESDPEPGAHAPQPAAPVPARPSIIPMLFGGIIAGLIGFAAAWFVWGRDGSGAELSARIDSQAKAITALETAVGAKTSTEALAALAARVEALESAPVADTSETDASLASQAEALAALTARIDALEKAPVEASEDPAAQAALAAYGREVEALRTEMAEQMARMNAALEAAKETEAQAAARTEEAAAAAARAAQQRALLDVQKALENGTAYGEALGRISSVEIPEGLSAHAAEGVMTLDALKASFPTAARGALKVAREAVAGEDGGGFGSWLTRQVGTRSLEPKEGDDPDAVLSRAEAALGAGDLTTVLAELAALPEVGQKAMDQWIAQATRRNDAVTGAEALSATLTSN